MDQFNVQNEVQRILLRVVDRLSVSGVPASLYNVSVNAFGVVVYDTDIAILFDENGNLTDDAVDSEIERYLENEYRNTMAYAERIKTNLLIIGMRNRNDIQNRL